MSEYAGLRFERPRRSIPSRMLGIGLTTLVFNLLWWRASHETLYWVLLVGITLQGWVASFGWRKALAALHELLYRLEQS